LVSADRLACKHILWLPALFWAGTLICATTVIAQNRMNRVVRAVVRTTSGILVVYDAAAPPDGRRQPAGYLGYWRDFGQRRLFVSRILFDNADAAASLAALERDLGVPAATLHGSDPVLERAWAASTPVGSDGGQWHAFSRSRVLTLMEFQEVEGEGSSSAMAAAGVEPTEPEVVCPGWKLAVPGETMTIPKKKDGDVWI